MSANPELAVKVHITQELGVDPGALTSRFTTRSWWLSGLRQLLFGAIAAGATYVVGMLIGVSVGG